MPKNTSITIGEHFDHFISGQIGSGRFHSTSEVVRAGLRLLEEEALKLENLRQSLDASEHSPIASNFNINTFISNKILNE